MLGLYKSSTKVKVQNVCLYVQKGSSWKVCKLVSWYSILQSSIQYQKQNKKEKSK